MFKNSSVAPYCPSISTDPFEFFSELPNLVHTCLSYLKSCLSLLISITVRYEITHYSLKTPETLMPLCFLILCSLFLEYPPSLLFLACRKPAFNAQLKCLPLSEALPFSRAAYLCTHCSLYISSLLAFVLLFYNHLQRQPISYSCLSALKFPAWCLTHLSIQLLLLNVNDLRSEPKSLIPE